MVKISKPVIQSNTHSNGVIWLKILVLTGGNLSVIRRHICIELSVYGEGIILVYTGEARNESYWGKGY